MTSDTLRNMLDRHQKEIKEFALSEYASADGYNAMIAQQKEEAVREVSKAISNTIALTMTAKHNAENLGEGVQQSKDSVSSLAESMHSTLSSIDGISESQVTTKSKFIDWPELYPNRLDRFLAQVAKLLRLESSYVQRWYHTVLPFKIEYKLSDEDSQVIYHAQVVYPHSVVHADIQCQLACPFNHISFSAKIIPFKANHEN